MGNNSKTHILHVHSVEILSTTKFKTINNKIIYKQNHTQMNYLMQMTIINGVSVYNSQVKLLGLPLT